MAGSSAPHATTAPTAGSLRRRAEHAGLAVVGALAALVFVYLAAGALGELHPAPAALADGIVDGGCTAGGVVGTNLLCFGFVWNSLATGVLIGVVAPLIGTYLVHREMALIGETLAHTAFAGVAVGLLVSSAVGFAVPVLLAALAAGLVGAFGVQLLAERTDAYGDVPIAIILTGSFAVGTLVISYGRGFGGVNIDSYLFGNASIVGAGGARLMGVLSAIVLVAVGLSYRQLLFVTFDEQAARVARLNVSAYNALLVVLTAVVVVGAMQILGIILVAAMLVVPVAAASAIAGSFRETVVLAILFGEASVIAGLYGSYAYGLAPGGAIVVVAIAIYLVAVVGSGRTGTLAAGA